MDLVLISTSMNKATGSPTSKPGPTSPPLVIPPLQALEKLKNAWELVKEDSQERGIRLLPF